MERFIKRINITDIDKLFQLSSGRTDIVGIINLADDRQVMYRNDDYSGLRQLEFIHVHNPEIFFTEIIRRKSSVPSVDNIITGVFNVVDTDKFKSTTKRQLKDQINKQNSLNTSKLIKFIDNL